MHRSKNKKKNKKKIKQMHYSKYHCRMTACCISTNLLLLAAKQEPHKKKPYSKQTNQKNIEDFLEKSQANGSAGRKRKDE